MVVAPIVFGFWSASEQPPLAGPPCETSTIQAATMTTDFDLCYQGRAVLSDGTAIVVHSDTPFPRELAGRKVTVAWSRADECWQLQSPFLLHTRQMPPLPPESYTNEGLSDERPFGRPEWQPTEATPAPGTAVAI
jgi:hypothetical protein